MDQYCKKIKELVESALKEKTGYEFLAEVGYNNDCTELICHIIVPVMQEKPNSADNWLYDFPEKVTEIIQKATDMVWEASTLPGRNKWYLKKGCAHWQESEADEFIIFEDGEFAVTKCYVDGVRNHDVDIASHAKDGDFEFCEEIFV